MDQELKMFYSEVEEERQAKGWTKKYLSEKIFNSQCTYFNILSGHRSPNYKTLKKLANGVGVKLIICLGDDID